MKTKYQQLKLCYLASRIYAGYATTPLNPEPYAYYSGWSCKWLVEDQINGDTNLTYYGSTPKAPWLSWGPYLWSDGATPRIDGTTWICPTDFMTDGTHPSSAGRNKVAMKLSTFFHTDETTKPWFLKNIILYATLSIQGFLSVPDNNLRIRDTVFLYLRNSSAPFGIVDSSVAVIDSITMRGAYNFYNAASGTYYLQTRHRNSVETWSRTGGEALVRGGLYEYNFTNSISKAYGNNLVFLGNRFCIYSGDVNQDGVVNLPDVLLAYNDAAQFVTGYVKTDVTGNRITDLSDIILISNNSANFVIKITP